MNSSTEFGRACAVRRYLRRGGTGRRRGARRGRGGRGGGGGVRAWRPWPRLVCLDLGEETVTGSVTSGEDEVRAVGECGGKREMGGWRLRITEGVRCVVSESVGLWKGGDSAHWAVLHSWIGQSCTVVKFCL
jgi:hypothetical protein